MFELSPHRETPTPIQLPIIHPDLKISEPVQTLNVLPHLVLELPTSIEIHESPLEIPTRNRHSGIIYVKFN